MFPFQFHLLKMHVSPLPLVPLSSFLSSEKKGAMGNFGKEMSEALFAIVRMSSCHSGRIIGMLNTSQDARDARQDYCVFPP